MFLMRVVKISVGREVGYADFQQFHFAEDGRPFVLEELPLQTGENFAVGVGADEIADSALVVDDAVGGEFFVAAHHCVRVYSDFGTIFPDRRNPFLALQLFGEYFLADGIGNL